MGGERRTGVFTITAVQDQKARASGELFKIAQLIDDQGEPLEASIPHWYKYLFEPVEKACRAGASVTLELEYRVAKETGEPMLSRTTGKQLLNIVGMEGVEKEEDGGRGAAGGGVGLGPELYARGAALAAYGPLVTAGLLGVNPRNTKEAEVRMLARWIVDGRELPL